jgi:hypothetical protein
MGLLPKEQAERPWALSPRTTAWDDTCESTRSSHVRATVADS